MRDITLVLLTRDRSPRVNYLADTLKNLTRGGVWESNRLYQFIVVYSGPNRSFLIDALQHVPFHVSTKYSTRAKVNQHVSDAFRFGASYQSPWVLYIEDDIDVCAKFLDSVGGWLDDYARKEFRLYPLGAAFDDSLWASLRDHSAWRYNVNDFYGTQAVVVRWLDAVSIANWLLQPRFEENPGVYDLHLQEWSHVHYPELNYFLTPLPNFVQHVGEESLIIPDRNTAHKFPAWAGRDWFYQSGQGEVYL